MSSGGVQVAGQKRPSQIPAQSLQGTLVPLYPMEFLISLEVPSQRVSEIVSPWLVLLPLAFFSKAASTHLQVVQVGIW